jgi:hypothetical protein
LSAATFHVPIFIRILFDRVNSALLACTACDKLCWFVACMSEYGSGNAPGMLRSIESAELRWPPIEDGMTFDQRVSFVAVSCDIIRAEPNAC